LLARNTPGTSIGSSVTFGLEDWLPWIRFTSDDGNCQWVIQSAADGIAIGAGASGRSSCTQAGRSTSRPAR
jgi:hypothetical protein